MALPVAESRSSSKRSFEIRSTRVSASWAFAVAERGEHVLGHVGEITREEYEQARRDLEQ